MPPPVLEITPEMVGPNRTDMTRAYLLSLMVWPDNPGEQKRIMRTAAALHMRETFRTNPAARDAIAPELIELGISVTSPEDIVKLAGHRESHGRMVGQFLANAVIDSELKRGRPELGLPLRLEQIKTYVVEQRVFTPSGKPAISRSTFVNTILPRFRSVTHLWAASVFINWELHPEPAGLPCPPGREVLFLAYAEGFRLLGIRMKHPRRRGHPQERLLDSEAAWVLPDNLPLITGGCDLRRVLSL